MNGAGKVAGGISDPGEVADAMLRARVDYEKVWQLALTPQERNNTEIDLAYITSDWRGMPARIERFASEHGCGEPNWEINMALPYGYAQSVLARKLEFTICDPLSSGTWRGAVRAQLWAGDPAAALQLALQGSELAPGEWLSILLVASRVALGQFEEAEAEITSRLQVETDALTGRVMIAAVRGDRDEVDRLLKQHYSDPQATDFWEPRLPRLGWRS